ncbi:MAG: class I SAM-dependent methyltransferase [Rhodobacteraceae bacterium]|nr:class I SAM-dependent methyltransferase [Paracoccaceae bacterium]
MSPRLTLGIAEGIYALPSDGLIRVWHPDDGADLSAFPSDRTEVVQPFRPDHDHWQAVGYGCAVAASGPAAMSVVLLPRAKAAARHMVAQAVATTDGDVIVDGAKTDGIESILRDLRKRVTVTGVLSKAHGKLLRIAARADAGALSDWRAAPRMVDGYQTAPGVFSADGPDPASVLLARSLPRRLGARVADLGAGWGYLARQIADRADLTELHLVEADHAALDCARVNVTDPRARFHWADATRWDGARRLDAVVTNPPFHTSRAARPALGQAFIAAAAGLLAPSGALWLVANRHLPYEAEIARHFARCEEIAGSGQFKILHASRPSRRRS